jgi:hypothetical protein
MSRRLSRHVSTVHRELRRNRTDAGGLGYGVRDPVAQIDSPLQMGLLINHDIFISTTKIAFTKKLF